ncbi:MAG TPA: hypothetical protein VGV17_11915 [Bosea sp. (in: a-proteobacteria)]|jgi:hypothetical protein|uniref:hypothetical protein n=1 Tax=Bosea sp. (in: a-proteobacteria) TaxID=1871050 RepID=UPI002DDD93A2|nr:hypothetical protein [Bosea sp. (in: a-proteobacteria)]HEV2554454.1 hypothetical protein [Bosea sp. (in: a-proteobacteria)]
MMPSKQVAEISPELVAEWPLPSAATLGSSVRLKGIEREIRRCLPWTTRKCVVAIAGGIVLRMSEANQAAFDAVSVTIAKALVGIEALPILPSEAEDILSMSSRERHKWLKDGRLKSAGTRTAKLRGRAKAVTFHVFDPRHIEDLLDEDRPVVWREDDARVAAEKRRHAAGKAARARAAKWRESRASETEGNRNDKGRPPLAGWEKFAADGLLR